MIRITDQYFWNFVFSVFFVSLVVMAAIILETEARLSYSELTLTDFALMALATYRLVRLVVADNAMKWLREQFFDAKKVGKGWRLEKPEYGPRRTLADLFTCPWCFGCWAALLVSFFYLLTAWAQFPVMLLALAGVATWLQQLAALTGYKAQQAKLEAGE